jgi:hypothetical protein
MYSEAHVRSNVQRLVEDGIRDGKAPGDITAGIVTWMKFGAGIPLTEQGLVALEQKQRLMALLSLDSYPGFSASEQALQAA